MTIFMTKLILFSLIFTNCTCRSISTNPTSTTRVERTPRHGVLSLANSVGDTKIHFNLRKTPTYLAEAVAFYKGLQVAISQGITRIIIEWNNLEVVNFVKGYWNIPRKIQNIADIKLVKLLLRHFEHLKINHIYHEGNKISHLVIVIFFLSTKRNIKSKLQSALIAFLVANWNGMSGLVLLD